MGEGNGKWRWRPDSGVTQQPPSNNQEVAGGMEFGPGPEVGKLPEPSFLKSPEMPKTFGLEDVEAPEVFDVDTGKMLAGGQGTRVRTSPVYGDPGQEAARRALEPNRPSSDVSFLPGGGTAYKAFADSPEVAAQKRQMAEADRLRQEAAARPVPQNIQGPSSSTQGATTGVSFLDQAYGRDILAGRPVTKPSMSYPALARQQGVTIPQFRSAQTRMNQNPMEEELFQSGLRLQGVDVPTYLQQEQFATTPGGSKRRRVSFLR